MAGPPTELPPDALWLELTQMPRPFRVVDLPRKGADGRPVGQVAMAILTHEESMAAQLAAARLVQERLKTQNPNDPGYQDLYSNQAAIEVLYRACKRVGDMRYPFFPSPGELRRHMTADEIGVMMTAYNRARAELGPIISHMTPQDLEAWTDVLIQGAEVTGSFLDYWSSDAKNQLLQHLGSLLLASRTASTSYGAQPSNTGDDTSSLPDPQPDDLPDDGYASDGAAAPATTTTSTSTTDAP